MKYILDMTLTGSAVMMLYFGWKRLLKSKLKPCTGFLLLKAAVIGYLFPLPFLKLIFEIIFPNANLDFSSQIPKEVLLIFAQKNTMLYDGESYHLNLAFQFQLLTAFIWGAVVSVVILFRMFQYCRRKKAFLQCAAAAPQEDAFLADRLAARYKVRRHIFLQKAEEKGDLQKKTKEAFTLGGFKPIIFYRNLTDGRDKEMVLHHEIIHIKRWDMAWRMLAFCAVAAHFYNPFAWRLVRELEKMCEMSCDDEVLSKRGQEERKRYAELILEMAERKETEGWLLAMSREGMQIKERIKNVLNDGKTNENHQKIICRIAILFMALLNAFLLFSKKDIQHYMGDMDEEEIEVFFGTDYVFVPDALKKDAEIPFSMAEAEQYSNFYDLRIMGSDSSYIYLNQNLKCELCGQKLLDGIAGTHYREAGGICTVEYYEAQICLNCHKGEMGHKKSQLSFKECPHD